MNNPWRPPAPEELALHEYAEMGVSENCRCLKDSVIWDPYVGRPIHGNYQISSNKLEFKPGSIGTNQSFVTMHGIPLGQPRLEIVAINTARGQYLTPY